MVSRGLMFCVFVFAFVVVFDYLFVCFFFFSYPRSSILSSQIIFWNHLVNDGPWNE